MERARHSPQLHPGGKYGKD